MRPSPAATTPAMTSTRLADGRELIYFDESERPHQHLEVDTRSLPLRHEDDTGEVRFDALTGDWVAMATHRGSRTYLPPSDQCPLCPSRPHTASEIPGLDYDVVVFENRFPSLGPALGDLPAKATPSWGIKAPAYGRCEVISFTAQHTGSFSALSPSRARTVLAALAQRTAWLSKLPGIQQVFPFENRGQEIGVTLQHPHGQIYAYSYLTPRAQLMAQTAHSYYERTGNVLLQHLLDSERDAGERMVLAGKQFSAYVPFAAHWPLEVHLVPHRQVRDLAELTDPELEELAELLLNLLRRFDALYDSPTPYIAAWHQAPLNAAFRTSSRLHLQLTSPRRAKDKLKFLAGSESAMGAFINDTTPEAIAQQLRDAKA